MKAIVGSWDHRPYKLLAEVTALRSRVRDLERALQHSHEENAQLRAALERHAIDLEGDMIAVDVADVDAAEPVEVNA